MPPAKSSRNHDDSRSDAANTKEKSASGTSSTKMRPITSQQGGSHLQKVTNASAAIPEQPPAEPVAPSLQWSSFERGALHAYSREHHLNTPSSYISTFHQTIFTRRGGIGMYSPTMIRRKKARQNKEQLTLAVRKHFNGVGIQENDVIVDLIYKIRTENASKSRGSANQSIITEE